MKTAKHPMQPIVIGLDGVCRFKENEIVRYLLDNGGIDLNKIAMLDFSDEDRTQFAQLIGYSVSGAGELSYFDDKVLCRADKIVCKIIAEEKEILVLAEKVVAKLEAKDLLEEFIKM